MDVKKQIREHFTLELARSSSETVRTRLFWADKFLKFAPDNLALWNKELVNRFYAHLEKEGYTPLTTRTALQVVKRVYDSAKLVHERERRQLLSGVDITDSNSALVALAKIQQFDLAGEPVWEMGKRWLPRAETDEVSKPALSLEEIQRIVDLAKSGELEPFEVAFSAVASIYGLRQGELQAIRPEHINYEEQTLFVMTEKGGERRKQFLCPEIIPYLKGYDFPGTFLYRGVPRAYSPWFMNSVFKNVCIKAGIEDRDGQAWHAFRRKALTSVRDSLARVATDIPFNIDHVMAAKIFFRWRLSSSAEMVDRYYTPENVLKIDKFVLEHCPVVELWR
jgi:integrase